MIRLTVPGIIKLNSRVVLHGAGDDDYDNLLASLITVRWSKMMRCDQLGFDT